LEEEIRDGERKCCEVDGVGQGAAGAEGNGREGKGREREGRDVGGSGIGRGGSSCVLLAADWLSQLRSDAWHGMSSSFLG